MSDSAVFVKKLNAKAKELIVLNKTDAGVNSLASSFKKGDFSYQQESLKVGSTIDGIVSGLQTALVDTKDFSFSPESFKKVSGGVDMSGLGKATFSAEQMKAAAFIIAASADEESAKAYHQMAISAESRLGKGAIDAYTASYDAMDTFTFSKEAFDYGTLKNHLSDSVTFNLRASVQDEYGNSFFKPVTLGPDQAGISFTLNNVYLVEPYTQPSNGTPMNPNRKSLTRAVNEWQLLNQEKTRIYPNYNAADPTSSSRFFTAEAKLIAPVTVGTDTYITAPLLPNQQINLIGLGTTPSMLTKGGADNATSIDSRIVLDTIYLTVTDASANAQTLAVKTANMPYSGFQKTPEGKDRDMYLYFKSDAVPVTQSSADVNGNALTVASQLTNGYTAILSIRQNATLNVQVGDFEIGAGQVTLRYILDSGNNIVWDAWATNNVIPSTLSTVLNPIVSQIATVSGSGAVSNLRVKVAGLTFEARFTNKDFHVRGTLLEVVPETENYFTLTGSPISVISPAGGIAANDGAEEMYAAQTAGMIAAAYIRNSNRAVTTLLETDAMLSANQMLLGNPAFIPSMRGIARHVVKSYYHQESWVAASKIASWDSSSLEQNIREALGNSIRAIVAQMMLKSSYGVILDVLGGGTKPHFTIGCDPVTHQYLYTQGDSRLLGDGIDCTVVQSPDYRLVSFDPVTHEVLTGTIFIAPTRPSVEGIDPLNFGNFVWVPQIIAELSPAWRGTNAVNEKTVFTRTLHCVNVGVLARIDVSGLPQTAGTKPAVNMHSV